MWKTIIVYVKIVQLLSVQPHVSFSIQIIFKTDSHSIVDILYSSLYPQYYRIL